MSREFWVNVYPNGEIGFAYGDRQTAIFMADPYTVVYRLHVKLKDNYKCQ